MAPKFFPTLKAYHDLLFIPFCKKSSGTLYKLSSLGFYPTFNKFCAEINKLKKHIFLQCSSWGTQISLFL